MYKNTIMNLISFSNTEKASRFEAWYIIEDAVWE